MMKRMWVFPLIALLIVACAGSGSNGARPAGARGDQGISGQVLIAPPCPTPAEDTSCPTRPHQAELTIENADGQEILHFTTSTDGSFTANLEPGNYTIVPQVEPGVPPYADPVDVTVEKRKYTNIVLIYDSGAR